MGGNDGLFAAISRPNGSKLGNVPVDNLFFLDCPQPHPRAANVAPASLQVPINIPPRTGSFLCSSCLCAVSLSCSSCCTECSMSAGHYHGPRCCRFALGV